MGVGPRSVQREDRMALDKNYDFDILVNEAERLVIAELERQLNAIDDGSVCLCEDCVLDMAALALNNVRPLYRASLLGSLYAAHAMEEEAYAKEVSGAVSQAIEKIRKNPSHD